MTPFIADLKRLALAATPGAPTRARDAARARLAAALSPERVLAMIAVIEAADRMRDSLGEDWDTYARKDFDAALAALDEEQT